MQSKVIFGIFLIIISQSVYSQNGYSNEFAVDDNKNVTFTRYVNLVDSISHDTLTKEEIYNRAYSYFIYNYVSGESVIQMEDKEKGVIVGKGIYPKVHMDFIFSVRYVDANHILRIDVKKGKARIILSLTEYKYVLEGSGGSTSNMKIADTYPLNQDSRFKTFFSNAFTNTNVLANRTLDQLERSLKEGNTSKSIEGKEW
jgi:hypothetical protein